VLATLGERWTTRIVALPGAPRVQSGPYRFVSHPNSIVVAREILVLPLVFRLVAFALVFSALNGLALGAHPHRERSPAERTAVRLIGQ
jgi:methyltransferase